VVFILKMMKISSNCIKSLNTLGLQPECADLALINDHEELADYLTRLTRHERDLIVVAGELSNTVLGDRVDCPLVLFRDGSYIDFKRKTKSVTVTVSGSYRFDSLVRLLCECDISGMELLSGIPGTIGGAIAQNVSAYGQQISRNLKSIRAFDLKKNSTVTLSSSALNFSYRTSLLKQTSRYSPKLIVLEATFEFSLNQDPDPLKYKELSEMHTSHGRSNSDLGERRKTVLEVRNRKGMVAGGDNWVPCVGSFFVSPIVDNETAMRIAKEIRGSEFAESFFTWYRPDSNHTRIPAALVMRAAGFLNGDQWGNVGLSPNHILALCFSGPASSGSEIHALSKLIQLRVMDQFNISLEYEVRFLGDMRNIEVDDFLNEKIFSPGKGEPEWVLRLGLPN
jgi:UDP-N-acetylmuramate dehydrogenase